MDKSNEGKCLTSNSSHTELKDVVHVKPIKQQAEFEFILTLLEENKLKKLILNDAGLTDKSIMLLAQAIRHNRSLEYLDLSLTPPFTQQGYFNQDAFNDLLQALAIHPTIKIFKYDSIPSLEGTIWLDALFVLIAMNQSIEYISFTQGHLFAAHKIEWDKENIVSLGVALILNNTLIGLGGLKNLINDASPLLENFSDLEKLVKAKWQKLVELNAPWPLAENESVKDFIKTRWSTLAENYQTYISSAPKKSLPPATATTPENIKTDTETKSITIRDKVVSEKPVLNIREENTAPLNKNEDMHTIDLGLPPNSTENTTWHTLSGKFKTNFSTIKDNFSLKKSGLMSSPFFRKKVNAHLSQNKFTTEENSNNKTHPNRQKSKTLGANTKKNRNFSPVYSIFNKNIDPSKKNSPPKPPIIGGRTFAAGANWTPHEGKEPENINKENKPTIYSKI
ncbi:MAG: hypothetical protein Tsb005_03990 [Gammaproteobacteria bacterium]